MSIQSHPIMSRCLPLWTAALLCMAGRAAGQQFSQSPAAKFGEMTEAQGIAGASCGGTQITQNLNPDTIVPGTTACNSAGGAMTADNFYARSYFIGAATNVNCVDFAVETTSAGGSWPVRVRLYRDTNGGAPNTASLVQLGPDVLVTIPPGTTNTFFTANFVPPVLVPTATTLVVELYTACRQTGCTTNPPGFPPGDGGNIYLGSNNLGQTAPTYIKAPGCGVIDYVNMAGINPNVHIIQRLGTTSPANPCTQPLPLCPADVAPAGGNGLVNVDDLLVVINTWGQNGNPNGPRPQGDAAPLPNGDCQVNVEDLLAVINSWGQCAAATGACCMPAGNCVGPQSAAQCASAGGQYQGNGSSCGTVICAPLPANDECAGAIAVHNGPNTITNANATSSNPAPPGTSCITGGAVNFTRDVWFDYTATCTGILTVDLCATTGSVTDTVLAIYTGNCGQLTQTGCDDDACGGAGGPNLRSMASVPVTVGANLKIRVGSWQKSPAGPMVLTLTCSPPNNDFCEAAEPIAIGGFDSDTLANATQDAAVECDGNPASIGRWYTVVGNGHTLTASTCTSPQQFTWNALISVYCGVSCDNLECVDSVNSNSCNFFHETISWCSAPGQTYWILVHASSTPTEPDGDYTLTVSDGPTCTGAIICGVDNDECVNALQVFVGATTATNIGATTSPGIPGGACTVDGAQNFTRDVWFKYTPLVTGVYQIDTCASTADVNDTVMSVFTGSCPALTEIGCDDDSCDGPDDGLSKLQLMLTGGQQVLIRIGSWSTSPEGEFTLTIQPPCAFNCPPGSLAEGEPCLTGPPDTVNGGCNSTPTVYGTITVNGPARCGTSSTYLNGAANIRDTDWYRFTSVGGTYHLEVNAQFSALVGLAMNISNPGVPCSGNAFVPGSTVVTGEGEVCTTVITPQVSLTPGQYAVYVAPSGFTGLPCLGFNSYWVRLVSP